MGELCGGLLALEERLQIPSQLIVALSSAAAALLVCREDFLGRENSARGEEGGREGKGGEGREGREGRGEGEEEGREGRGREGKGGEGRRREREKKKTSFPIA